MKILIAEDSVHLRDILKTILNGAGYSDVIEAENGEEAIEKIKAENPDLVLLDIIMPGTDGIDVLREVGDQMKKVIVISSVKDENLMIKVESFGVKNYIVKPFENEQVVAEVKKALE